MYLTHQDMITREDILQFIETRKASLFHEYHLVKIGLFGSFARKEESENSDIDIIIEFEPNTPNITEIKKNLKSLFENHFHRKVDLCREKYIKPYYKETIIQTAIYV